MTDAARVVIPEPPPQGPWLVQSEPPQAPTAPAAVRGTGRRAARWIAAGLAVIVIAGLAFAVVRQTGRLSDAREELAARKATIGGLTTQVNGLEKKVADVIEAKDGLADDVSRLQSDVDTCRVAAQASQALSRSLRDTFEALFRGDRAAFAQSIRQTDSLQRKADGATSSCIRATEGDVTTL